MWPGVLAAALLLQAALAPNPDWQAEGRGALDRKNYPAAIAALEKAVAADAKDYAARFNLALAYSLAGKDDQAIAEYWKTLDLKPELYEANLNLGILLLRNKQAARAVPVLRRAVSAKPHEIRPALYLADALLGAAQLDEARQAYESVLSRDPKEAAAELGLGRVLARKGELEGAAKHLELAARLDPSYSEALLELAEQYEADKRTAEAAAIYAKFTGNAAAQERAGEILLSTGQAAEAVPHLEFAANTSPTSANRLALATAYFAVKETAKGAKTLNDALAADPGNYDLRMLAGRVLRDHKRYNDAASQLTQAVALKPESIEAWGEVVAVSTLSEDYPRALAALDRLKSLGAEKTPHLYLRAIILDKLKQYQPALDNYRRFLAASEGKFPEEEFKSRQRARIVEKELSKR